MLTRLVPALYRILRLDSLLRHRSIERLFLPAYFLYKRFEDPFAALSRRHPELFHGGDILDVGANVGYTASVFAQVVDRGRRVWAFEPEPLNVARLRRVIDARGLRSIVVPVEFAVGERAGETSLNINRSHPGDHWIGEAGDAIPVKMTTLDVFVAEHDIRSVAFVKIDVQGYELFVSRGMERLLDGPVSVAFEISSDSRTRFGYEPAELLAFYSARRFNLHLIGRGGTLTPASPERIARLLERRGYTDVLATRDF